MDGVLADFAETFGFGTRHGIPVLWAFVTELWGFFLFAHGAICCFFSIWSQAGSRLESGSIDLDDPQGGFGGEGEEVGLAVGEG